MSKFRKIWGLAFGLVGVALLVGGVAMSSNMGFKYTTNIGTSQNFNLSLPWNNNYGTAADLLNDFSGVPHNSAIITNVSQFTAGGTLATWIYAGAPATNFAINKGEAYVLLSGGSGATEVVVGSHDPNFVFSIPANSNFNISVPYHGTHATAADLLNDMSGVPHNSAIVTNLSQFTAGGTLATWIYAGAPATNFSLNLGEGVIALAGGTGLSNYAYPHY